jgi:protein CrcB
MITYLWIALGGALGSVGRAWVAELMVRLTGPRFPWGTILINVVGSFVIGCFSTLTSSDSRFALPADARVFVMVGICGGFTTFSSFSLQTLDLARDGRPLQALGNVGLSLFLCLAAVAAGHYSADAVRRGGAVQQGALAPVVMAVLERPDSVPGLLGAAERLAEVVGYSRITAMVTGRPAFPTIMPGDEIATADRGQTAFQGMAAWPGQLRQMSTTWLAGASARGLVATVAETPAASAGQATKAAGMIVIQRAAHSPVLHAVLFETGRPVLVVPPQSSPAAFGQVVAIAWRDDEAARRAVQSSLPWLRRASQVHVLHGGAPGATPPDFIRRRLPGAQWHVVASTDVGAALLALCHQLGADLLVMGAFARGEWLEAMTGGVTTTMLAEADLPLLMQR